MLWFDVGIKRYTTSGRTTIVTAELWFDVGIKRYTTQRHRYQQSQELWFDVGIKRYTTLALAFALVRGCGLM